MITKEIAMQLKRGDTLMRPNLLKPGHYMTMRVNGKCKTWKTRPNEFSLPVKYGLRDCFYIDQNTAKDYKMTPNTEATLGVE